ncbi:MAG: tryptophan synthase subunit alpha [Endomicrobiales bacterium]|nr:tryptophan synthase subunit alpha [Endomicrobiales bacterium]
MTLLKNTIIKILDKKKKVFVGCLTAGYPDIKSTVELSGILANSGIDILELCVPFSDPIADGPTIQYSSEIALKKGINLKLILDTVSQIKKRCSIPVILMSYLNPLIHFGLDKFFRMSKKAGVDGYIIPDIIPDDYKFNEIKAMCIRYGLSVIPLIAPNTPNNRLRYIDKKSDSFVYIVSLTGVTGARKSLPADIANYLTRTKINIRHPRFLGFGISHPNHVKSVRKYVDGIIVASAIINIIRKNKTKSIRNKKISQFIKSLRKELD